MSNLGPSFDRAQRQYDAQMPPDDDDHCEKECPACEGTGWISSEVEGAVDQKECENCDGSGVVESHAWRFVRSDGDVSLTRCRRCGAEEVS